MLTPPWLLCSRNGGFLRLIDPRHHVLAVARQGDPKWRAVALLAGFRSRRNATETCIRCVGRPKQPAAFRDNRCQLREHDVVIRLPAGHPPLTLALECRDRSRPVGVEQVEAFNQKCLDNRKQGLRCLTFKHPAPAMPFLRFRLWAAPLTRPDDSCLRPVDFGARCQVPDGPFSTSDGGPFAQPVSVCEGVAEAQSVYRL